MKGITQQGDFGGQMNGSILDSLLNAAGLTKTTDANAQVAAAAAAQKTKTMEYALIGCGLLAAVYVTAQVSRGRKLI